MAESIISKIKAFAHSQSDSLPFPVATMEIVSETERALGYSLPALLRECYLQVGNGGFGPGEGLIGLKGGHPSDYGNLVELHGDPIEDRKKHGINWPPALLRFCSWGGNMFACVDCRDTRAKVSMAIDAEVEQQDYSLEKFFELWMDGVDPMDYKAEYKKVAIVNPSTGKKTAITKRILRSPRRY